MIRRPPRSTRTDTLCPYTTLFRSPPRYTPMQEFKYDRVHTPAAHEAARQEIARKMAAFEAANGPVETLPIRTDDKRIPYRITRSEEHTSELQSLMRISYAVFCLKKKKNNTDIEQPTHLANKN